MNLGDVLTATARRHPDHIGLVWDGGVRRRTYRELEERATAFAAGLVSELGVQPGDRVGLMMANGPDLLEALFGTWKAGATAVPLNARFTEEEVEYHLGDSEARVFVAGGEFAETVGRIRDRLTGVESVVVGPDSGALVDRHLGRPAPAPDVTDDDVAWLAYTSGTTGRPKGAMLTHGCLTFVAVSWLADLQRLDPQDVGLYAAPLTHGAGIMALAFTMKGCTQVLLGAFDPVRFCETVAAEGVTHTWLVPTQIKMLLDHADAGLDRLKTLKTIVYGGSPMYVEDLKEAIRRIGPVFVQLFAQTESPMTGTYMRAADHIVDGPGSERLASCGHARSGIDVAILDDADRPLPPGETGEIGIRGPALMKGYWKRPDATAETLRGGWLHTGDIGRMDDGGYVYILDRSKDMLISGGLNVYPREIEEVLLRHPGISEVAVIGVPDDTWGETVKAIVVPGGAAGNGSAEIDLTEADVVAFAADRLAGYKKPRSVDLVASLPKTTYGKVDKKALRARYWAGRERMV